MSDKLCESCGIAPAHRGKRTCWNHRSREARLATEKRAPLGVALIVWPTFLPGYDPFASVAE